MKKIIMICLFTLFIPFLAQASFLICDPQPGIDWYMIDHGGIYFVTLPEEDYSLRWEVPFMNSICARAGTNVTEGIQWSEWSCLGDLNGDGDVDGVDLLIFSGSFGRSQ